MCTDWGWVKRRGRKAKRKALEKKKGSWQDSFGFTFCLCGKEREGKKSTVVNLYFMGAST